MNNIQLILTVKYEEKFKEMYVNFKSEFLSNIWSPKYRDFMLENFKLLNNNYLLLLIKDKEVIGAILINFKNNIGYIEELEITSKYQKRGLGKTAN